MSQQPHIIDKHAIIYFENGMCLEGRSFGAEGTCTGEVIFNTSLSGYQEIVSDPSYAGQLITFCLPEMGNVGANRHDNERDIIHTNGVIVRNYNENYSNFRGEESFGDFLKRHNKIGIYGVDTRQIVKMIRDGGALMAVISTEQFDEQVLQDTLQKAPRMADMDFTQKVSTPQPYRHQQSVWNDQAMDYANPPLSHKKIVAVDFGIKQNILNELCSVGLSVEVIAYGFKATELIKRFDSGEIGGIFLSNGPGDPMVVKNTIAQEVKALIDHNIPLFGICFGHQLLSIACGFDTYKLPFGHHGGNHPVRSVQGQVEITAQNHIYTIPPEITQVADIIATNLFDGTIQGVKYKNRPIFSLQYHPESSPGPQDSKSYFQQFADMVR